MNNLAILVGVVECCSANLATTMQTRYLKILPWTKRANCFL